jgi:hypothetical protein
MENTLARLMIAKHAKGKKLWPSEKERAPAIL